MTENELIRQRIATYYNRCPVCTHRPRKLTRNNLTGGVSYRHAGLRVLSHDELCDGCASELAGLAEQADLAPEVVLRPKWRDTILALFD